MSSSLNCLQLAADPDISGIGVRVAIYMQNLLSFIPAIWALWDGKVTKAELDSVETQSTTILITAFAILIAAVHKSLADAGRIEGLSSWIKHIRDKAWTNLGLRNEGLNDAEQPPQVTESKPSPSNDGEATAPRPKSPIQRAFRRIVLVLGSLHLSLMAGLGIWLWSNPTTFGTHNCPINEISTSILGQSVPLRSGQLRRWSIAIYSLFLLPGFNLILPMGLFLGLFLGYQTFHKHVDRKTPSIVPTVIGLVLLLAINIIFLVDIELTLLQASGESGWSFGQILAMLLLVLPLRDLVETFLSRREKQRIKELARHEMQRQEELASRETQRKKEHTQLLRNAIKDKATPETILALLSNGADVNTVVEGCDYATVLQLATHRQDVGLVRVILEHSADVDIRGELVLELCGDLLRITIEGGKYETALQVGARRSPEIVKLLLEYGADPNIEGGAHGTALQAVSDMACWEIVLLLLAESRTKIPEDTDILRQAIYAGEIEVVRLLLEKGADPNFRGGEYGTALQAASMQDVSPDGFTRSDDPVLVQKNLKMITLLLDMGADPNVEGGKYGTALQAASYQGKLEVVAMLLEEGADPNAQCGEYGTALQAASMQDVTGNIFTRSDDPVLVQKNLKMITLLLDMGADPNVQGGKYGTALQAASYMGKLEVVTLLLEQGADLNLQGGEYGTALQAALYMGKLEVVMLLLEQGADLNLQGGEYRTALQAASIEDITGDGFPPSDDPVLIQKNLKMITLLLDMGADPNVQGGKYGTALQAASYMGKLEVVMLLLEQGADLNLQGGEYGTALQAALYKGKLEVVTLLLEKGADPNAQCGEYGTALQAASIEDITGDFTRSHDPVLIQKNLKMITLLLDMGADPFVQGGKYGTALQAASYTGKLEVVMLLLEKGADPNTQCGEYGTALQAASMQDVEGDGFPPSDDPVLIQKNLKMITLLLDMGADPNVQGGKYGTALQAASYQGKLEVVTLLLEKGADPNAQCGEYGTALQAASMQDVEGDGFPPSDDPVLIQKNLKMITLLLDMGADPNVQGGKYGTALQAASYQGKLEVVTLLLEKGADPNAQCGEYGTALQAASYKGKLEVVTLLLEQGADSNLQGGEYGTAPRAASVNKESDSKEEIKKLLLARGADPTLELGSPESRRLSGGGSEIILAPSIT
ncbi:ankyrin repeat-containing domain protein [Mycena leptocephala]|nr:ankyrin repeat-containing domain protein [Mycena leptocephala]